MTPRFTGIAATLLAVSLLAASGCNRLYSVSGTVVLEDGTPLNKGMVIFESVDGTVVARGAIGADGTFLLSSNKPNDGVKPGKYRALISGYDMSDVPDEQKNLPFDFRYTRLQTSGLEFEVGEKANVIAIKLKRKI